MALIEAFKNQTRGKENNKKSHNDAYKSSTPFGL